jgi:hypothetical protein
VISDSNITLNVPGATGPDNGAFDVTAFSFGVNNAGVQFLTIELPVQAGSPTLLQD